MLKRIYSVSDMHCSSCAMLIEALEDILPGVKRVKASYKWQTVEVE